MEKLGSPSNFQPDLETVMRQGADAIRLAKEICAASAELLAMSAALCDSLKHDP